MERLSPQLSTGGLSASMSVMSQSMVSSSMGNIGSTAGAGRRATGMGGGRRMSLAAVDVSGFAASNFQPEYYLQFNLDDDTPESIGGIRRSLELSQTKAVTDLQKSVHRSYGDFVQVTKELAGFEGKMNELHSIINQLNNLSEVLLVNVPCSSGTTAAAMNEEASAEPSMLQEQQPAQKEDGQIPGVTDLVERRAKVNRLVQHVSDLEEYLDEKTGRYIVFEGVDVAYQPAAAGSNGKHEKSVYVYLLNDSLLATGKKSKLPLGTGKKYYVEFNIPFVGLSTQDIKEAVDNKLFGLKILQQGEPVGTLYFQSQANKRLWQDQIKKAMIGFKMEEAAKNSTLHLQSVAKERYVKKATRSSLAARAGHRRGTSSLAQKRAAELASANLSGTTTASNDLPIETFNRLLYMLDDLDQASTRRLYDQATELVDQVVFNLNQLQAVHHDSSRIHQLRRLLEGKKKHLADLLMSEISRLLVSKSEMIHYIQMLTILGWADGARERFLTARSDLIRKQTKALNYSGNPSKSVQELVSVFMNGIRTTADWYRSAFDDQIRLSGLMFWVRLEIIDLCSTMSKLLFSGGMSCEAIGQTIAQAREQCETLQDIGLNFVYSFDDALAKPIISAMEKEFDHISPIMKKSIKDEALVEFVTLQDCQVPGCMKVCHDEIVRFMASFQDMLHSDLGHVLANQLACLFELCSSSLLERFYSPDTTSISNQSILLAMEYLADTFFPSIYHQLTGTFEQDFANLKKLRSRLSSSIGAMYDILTENCAASWLPSTWESYQIQGELPDDATVSAWILQMLPQLSRLSKEAPQKRRLRLLDHLTDSLVSALSKVISSGTVQFTVGGLEQLFLDVHFIMKAWDPFATQDLIDESLELCGKAIEVSGISPAKNMSWYQQKVDLIVLSVPKAILDFVIDS